MPTDTKTALMDHAEHVARAKGFDGFSYADLAEAVGIKKASIHYHFATKAALSVALMERYHEAVQALCAEIETQNPTAGARLLALIDVYRNAIGDGRSLCLCVSFTLSRESLSDKAHLQIDAFRAMVTDWLTGVFELGREDGTIRDVMDPTLEAHAALALLEGAQLAARGSEDVALFEKAVSTQANRCREI